jgi:LCP family protein required for cell wall assembly
MRRLLVGLVIGLAVVAVVLLVMFLATSPGTPIATPTPSPTPIPLDQALLNRRVTFLLLGTDQNAKRQAAGETPLTDSMVVLSINATHTKLTMISIPRDSVDIPLSDGSTWREKLNGLYSANGGEMQGADTLADAFDALLGSHIDYKIVVDMDDLVKIVDAFGGVDVRVTKAINDPTVNLRITAGSHHLDGKTALAYSRSRHTTNDFERAARQQQVLVALLARFNKSGVSVDVPKLLGGLSSLQTDIPDDKIPTLIEIARRSKAATVNSQVLQPPRFFTVSVSGPRGYTLEPKLDAMHTFTQPLLNGP